MDTLTIIGVCAAGVLGTTCATLALWCKYRDGILGHVSLAGVAICALIVVLDATDESEYELLPTTTGVFVAMAVFMLRHAWRAWQHRDRKNL